MKTGVPQLCVKYLLMNSLPNCTLSPKSVNFIEERSSVLSIRIFSVKFYHNLKEVIYGEPGFKSLCTMLFLCMYATASSIDFIINEASKSVIGKFFFFLSSIKLFTEPPLTNSITINIFDSISIVYSESILIL